MKSSYLVYSLVTTEIIILEVALVVEIDGVDDIDERLLASGENTLIASIVWFNKWRYDTDVPVR